MDLDIKPGKPTLDALKELYKVADIRVAEAKIPLINEDWESLQKTIEEPNTLTYLAKKGDKLVGFLHGRTDGGKHGRIRDLAFDPNDKTEKIEEELLTSIANDYPNVRWRLASPRIEENLSRDLNLIQTLYAVTVVLGFQKLGESVYLLRFPATTAAWLNGCQQLLMLALALSLALVGTRFFWAVGNVRRRVEFLLSRLKPLNRGRLVLIHVPALFAHALIFFLLCRIHADHFDMTAASSSVLGSHTTWFIGMYMALMWINAAWLFLLVKDREKGNWNPEKRWILNNTAMGLLAFAILVLRWSQRWPWIDLDENALWICFFLLAGNSLIDILGNASAYILGDQAA